MKVFHGSLPAFQVNSNVRKTRQMPPAQVCGLDGLSNTRDLSGGYLFVATCLASIHGFCQSLSQLLAVLRVNGNRVQLNLKNHRIDSSRVTLQSEAESDSDPSESSQNHIEIPEIRSLVRLGNPGSMMFYGRSRFSDLLFPGLYQVPSCVNIK